MLFYTLYIISYSKELIFLLDIFEFKNSVPLILISYFIGHCVQATSNIFSKTEIKKKSQNDKHKNIQEKVLNFFEIPKEEIKNTFQYCYFYVLSKSDILGKELVLFNSLYGLYRGFYCSLLMSFLVSMSLVIVKIIAIFHCNCKFNLALLLYSIVCFILTLLFRLRASRFFDYLGKKTYIAFDVLRKEENKVN
ncbi:MAG: hypothetical protein JJW01_00950 [Alphaproteobacteria bacterium]|nr:hypothetical protein [Rickettsiales bacterium]